MGNWTAMSLRSVAEIRDPVHGYVRITEVERDLIDSPFIQRLRRIHQLAGSYLVYPGAVHSRFEHVIGTMYVAGQIAEYLKFDPGINEEEIQEIRLAALLHDVGHGPFSHMYEEVLAEKSSLNHEDLSQRIIRETSIGDILERHGFSKRKLAPLAVGNQRTKPRFMNEIIAGGLSADIMDYLLRDSYFTGVEYGKVDVQRVVHSLIVSGGRMVLDEAALPAFEAILLARYQMFKAVYFHRTVRAAELMLVQSMRLADDALGLTELSNLDHYLELTDEVVLHSLVSLSPRSPELKEAKSLAEGFLNRKLMKCVFERLVQRRDRAVSQLFAEQGLRNRVVSDLAKRAGVDSLKVFLDVPTTPSVPYTSSKEALTHVMVFRREGERITTTDIPVSRLPLVGSIAGFMNIIRVYTDQSYRWAVERATQELLGDERYLTRVSFGYRR
jgi:HD superfamily phosphohydrolase